MQTLADTPEDILVPESSMDPTDLFRLMLILSIGLLIFYTLSGHVIDQLKILVIHESTVGVLTGMFI